MLINARPKIRRLFKLRTILLVVMLSVLMLPLGSIYFLRFYENELVRKTELELISQSAALAATFRHLIGQEHLHPEAGYQPVLPMLDLSTHPLLPRRPNALPASAPVHPLLQQTGQQMQAILANTQQVTLAGMRILDNQGTVIAGQQERGMSLAHVPEVKSALQGHYHSVIRERVSDEPPPAIASLSRGTKIRVFTAFPVIDNGKVYGVIYLSRTPQNILKHLYARKEKVLLLSLLILSLTGLLVLFISSRLSRPIRELITQTNKLTHGEIETVDMLKQPGTYELAELSRSFSEMSHALHERSSYINKFASHVSHEFKTPLTSMQGTLELLEEHIDDMPLDQRQRFFNNLQADTQRLKQLVNRLLEQARADSTQATTATCQLGDVLRELQASYSYNARNPHTPQNDVDHGLAIVFSAEQTDIVLKIDADALKIILGNLFDNSQHHGATEIHVQVKPETECCVISVIDNGEGISEANRSKIFTPFFTTRREEGGTGLGLGIIESLLKAWNGSIQLKDSQQGAHFELRLHRQ